MVQFTVVALLASVAVPALSAPVRTICHNAQGCTGDTLITLPDRRAVLGRADTKLTDSGFKLPDQHFAQGQDGCTNPKGCSVPAGVQIARALTQTVPEGLDGCSQPGGCKTNAIIKRGVTQTVPEGLDGCSKPGGCRTNAIIKREQKKPPQAHEPKLSPLDKGCPIEGCNLPTNGVVA